MVNTKTEVYIITHLFNYKHYGNYIKTEWWEIIILVMAIDGTFTTYYKYELKSDEITTSWG